MRSRITITISKDLLTKVDSHIDGNTVRNRSQAIESLLRQSVSPTIDTAVILAGGSGTNLKKFKGQPAVLIPINKIPLLNHTLNHLKNHGFTKAILCINSKDTKIKQVFGNGNKFGLNLTYSVESTPLGTGGALKKAGKLITGKPFLLIHADILTNINLTEFANFYHAQQKKASVAIKPREGKLAYGRVYLQGSQVVDFQQPTTESPVSLINTGLYIFDSTCLRLLSKAKKFDLEETLLPKLIKHHQLTGYTFQGIWYDITDSHDYQEANRRWQKL